MTLRLPTPKPYSDKNRPALKWTLSFTANGKRRREFFKTRTEAEATCTRLKAELAEHGRQAFALTAAERQDAIAAFKLLRGCEALTGKSLTEVIREVVAHQTALASAPGIEAVYAQLLASAEKKCLSEFYERDLRTRLRRFISAFAGRNLSTITAREIQEWLGGLSCGPVTRGNLLRLIRVLFNYAIKKGFVTVNPAAGVEIEKAPKKPTGILTPEAMTRLLSLATSIKPQLVPALAIQAFAGLRTQELIRLDWQAVMLDAGKGVIVAESDKNKTARHREVAIRENLREWLSPYARKEGTVVPRNYHRELTELRRTLAKENLRFPRNGLRHSFGSYAYAENRDAAKTAADLGHTSTSMLFRYYRTLVPGESATVWWNIRPESASTPVALTIKTPPDTDALAA